MWVARSTDDGMTFAPEEPAWDRPTGASAGCGTSALADGDGTLYLLYRAAVDDVGRDMFLLTSRDRGARFRGTSIHPWQTHACPMSTASLSDFGSGAFAAWETQGQVYFARIEPDAGGGSSPSAPPGAGVQRRHPLVANAGDDTILVWSESTDDPETDSLVWQLFDRSGHPVGEPGRRDYAVAAGGSATVVAHRHFGFTIIHTATKKIARVSKH
jgi:hypothetical protein